MRRLAALIVLAALAVGWAFTATSVELNEDYLYFRDANVPPFQKSREFFDMPNRPGQYEVTMISESTGPLTFKIIRVKEERETTESLRRSYSIGNHEFQAQFTNPSGDDNLIVEIANSNPAVAATVSVIVVEVSND